MDDTTVQPINPTKVLLELELERARRLNRAFNDTSNTQCYNPNDTSYKPEPVPDAPINIVLGYNRKVYRYAKKHKISPEKAFKRLYK